MNLRLHLILLVINPLRIWLSVLRMWMAISFFLSFFFKFKFFKVLQSLSCYFLVLLRSWRFSSCFFDRILISPTPIVLDIWGYSMYTPFLDFFFFIALTVLLEFQSLISRYFQLHLLDWFHPSHPLVKIVA
jgi:hypothetical protein